MNDGGRNEPASLMPRSVFEVVVMQLEVGPALPHNFDGHVPDKPSRGGFQKCPTKWPHHSIELALRPAAPHDRPMPANPIQSPDALSSVVPKELPESFFHGLSMPNLPHAKANPQQIKPNLQLRAMALYDVIIDDILTHPDTSLADTARRLGRSASTISLVARSDFFRARWHQRREKFNEDLSFRLQTKMAAVAEKSLDTTLAVLKKKGDNIPLPVLTELNSSILDRLGYGVRPSASPTLAVQINNSQNGSAPTPAQATPDGLAKARDYLRMLEEANASSGPSPGAAASLSRDGDSAGPVVEGEAHRVES